MIRRYHSVQGEFFLPDVTANVLRTRFLIQFKIHRQDGHQTHRGHDHAPEEAFPLLPQGKKAKSGKVKDFNYLLISLAFFSILAVGKC